MSHPAIEYMRQAAKTYHPGWGVGEYSDWQDEQLSWKTTCYLGDWSFLWEARLDGPGALDLLRDSAVNSFARFDVGQAKHLVQCNEAGKVIGDGVLMRLGEDSFTTQSTTAFWTAYLAHRGGYDVMVSKPDTFQLQVSGPTALATCQKATGEELTDIGFMRFRTVRIAGVEVRALRQGMAGEIGFEFHGDGADAETVRTTLLEAGAEFGIRRLGKRTAMINHLEAAFPTGGWHYLADFFSDPEFLPWMASEFDTKGLSGAVGGSFESADLDDYLFSPFELGWGKSVKFDHDFTGRAALEREAENPRRLRVTLEWDDEDVVDIYRSLFDEAEPYEFLDVPHQQRWVFRADAVLDDTGRTVGISTVPGYSRYFRKVLTLAYVQPGFAEPGTKVRILWGEPGARQKTVTATVASAPYKQDRRRTDLATEVTH